MFSGALKAGAALVLAGIAAALAPPAAAAFSPQLIDQIGRPFTLETLRGRPLIVTFVAAHCTQACPLVNARFARAQALFDAQRLDARLLTITLEPERDTPAVMSALAKRFGAEPQRWLVASGRAADVRVLLNAFGVRTGSDHSTFVYVFDRNGTLRDRIFASSILETQLAGDVRAMDRRGR